MKKLTSLAFALLVVAQFCFPAKTYAYSGYYGDWIKVTGIQDDQWVSGSPSFDVTVYRPDRPTNSVSVELNTQPFYNHRSGMSCSVNNLDIPYTETIRLHCSFDSTTGFSNNWTYIPFENGNRYVLWVDVHPSWMIGYQSFRVDNEKPQIELANKNLNILIQNSEESYVEEGGTVSDKYSGVSGGLIISTSFTDKNGNTYVVPSVDSTKNGTYVVTYTVSDVAGNITTLNRTVKVDLPVAVVVPTQTNTDTTEQPAVVAPQTQTDTTAQATTSAPTLAVSVTNAPSTTAELSGQSTQPTVAGAQKPATEAVKGATETNVKAETSHSLNWLWALLAALVVGSGILGFALYRKNK